MHKPVQDFEQQLEAVMAEVRRGHHQPATADDDLLQLARTLASTDLSQRSQIRQSLRQQLTDQHQSRQTNGGFFNMRTLNFKQTAATAAMIMIVMLVSAPLLTTFAQSLLVEVGLFNVTTEQETYEAAPVVGTDSAPTATPLPPDIADQVQTAPITSLDGAVATNLSAAAAADLAGFDVVREPASLPAGYEFNGRIVFATGNVTVDSMWNRPLDTADPNAPLAFFSISQTAGDVENTFGVGPQASVIDVQIGDLPASFIHQANMGSTDGRLFNLLLWQDGVYTYMMSSPTLSQAEMLAIATSMYE